MCDRVVAGRVLGDSRKDSGLGYGQFRYIFIKITLGSCLNAECILPEIDRVQIILEDLLFCQTVLKLDRKVLFLHFSFDPLGKSSFFSSVKDLIFQKLLCECTGTLMEFSAIGQTAERRTKNSLKVDSVMHPETLVLNGDKSILQMLRNGIQRRVLAVGLFSHKCLYGLSLAV